MALGPMGDTLAFAEIVLGTRKFVVAVDEDTLVFVVGVDTIKKN